MASTHSHRARNASHHEVSRREMVRAYRESLGARRDMTPGQRRAAVRKYQERISAQ